MHNLENSNLGLKFQIGKTQYLQQYPPKSTQESVNVVLEQNFNQRLHFHERLKNILPELPCAL